MPLRSSFRGARSASFDVQLHIRESITTIGSMDSGPAPKKAHLRCAIAHRRMTSLEAVQEQQKQGAAMSDLSAVKALVFDVFGTVVDWRTSLIADFTKWSER